jgi:hypothetical protein
LEISEETIGTPTIPQRLARFVTIDDKECPTNDVVFRNDKKSFTLTANRLHEVVVLVGTGQSAWHLKVAIA